MADAKHTPPPWNTFPMPTKHFSEAQANHRLAIASADLLAAADKLWGNAVPRGAPVRHYIVDREDMDALRAAIAKATGGK